MNAYLEHPIFSLLSQTAGELGCRAFVIGGYVRDCFLCRPCTDIDIVTEGSGIALAEAVGKRIETKVHVFKNFGTAQLVYHDMNIEFVGARRESYRRDSRKPIVESGSIEDDQKRRDFTINAMAFSLQPEDFGALIDPFGGIRDLNRGLLRTPLDPCLTFSDDPLRMIRAIRFACQLDFTIDPETFAAIARNKDRLAILSKERITEELHKIIDSQKPSKGFRLLDRSELLPLILPELSALKGVKTVEGKGHKEIFDHTLQVLDHLSQCSDKHYLRWAALLHDIGKPITKHFDPETGWSFHGHDYIGSKMIPGLFRRLAMPTDERMRYVQKLVLLHLRPIALVQDEVTDSGIRRLLFDAGDDIDDLMLLCQADITSTNEATVRRHKANFELVKKKLIEVEEKDAIRNFQPPISGELIMQTYHLPPCKEVGLIKDSIKEAILDGRIHNSFEEAYALMQEKAAEILKITPPNA